MEETHQTRTAERNWYFLVRSQCRPYQLFSSHYAWALYGRTQSQRRTNQILIIIFVDICPYKILIFVPEYFVQLFVVLCRNCRKTVASVVCSCLSHLFCSWLYVQYPNESHGDLFVCMCRYNVRMYVHVVENGESISLHPSPPQKCESTGERKYESWVCVSKSVMRILLCGGVEGESESGSVSQSWGSLDSVFCGNSNLWQGKAVGNIVVCRSLFWLRSCRKSQTRVRVTNMEVRYIQWLNAVLWHSCMNINL